MFGEKKEKKQKRFIVKEEQSLGFGLIYVVVDREIGGSSPEHITPLLDSNGNVVIDNVY